MTETADAVDREVRLFVYRHFLDEGVPPTVAEAAEALAIAVPDAEASFRRLEANRVLVFAPGTLDIWMANPLCAYPTSFWVETPRGAWWGTCIWDALGIPAMLGEPGVVRTTCADCGEPFTLTVDPGEGPDDLRGLLHFAVPARHWWDDIGFL